MLKGLYLAACKARHEDHNIIYQDIEQKKYKTNLGGDMLEIDFWGYDYIIATPPCNWWSKANPYYWYSEYALKTRHLLPCILMKCAKSGKPFVIECTKNLKRYTENRIFRICEKFNINWQVVGRHVYFSNKNYNLDCPQIQDFKYGGVRVNNDGYNQGGTNVHNCIELWIQAVEKELNNE